MKKRILIILSAATVIFVIAAIIINIYINFFYAKSIDLSYGDTFSDINIYNHSGEKTDFSKTISKYKVIFYVSNHCQACLNDLDAISRIIKLYNSNDFEFVILWEGGFPENRIKNSGIDINKNYSLRNQVKLSSLTPKEFIIDGNNRVIFTSDSNLELLTNKILEIQGEHDYSKRAFNIIRNDYKKMPQSDFDINKPSVILFSTDGCEECKKVKKEININTQMKNKANIIIIETGINDDKSLYNDYLNLFSRTFNIDFYPSYYIIDSGGNPVKYCKTLQDVINQIT